MLRIHQTRIAVAIGAFLMITTTLGTAYACGGFFCNAQTQSPIYQAGERIVFSSNPGGVDMHIEIMYSGEPTDFGWLLPIIGVPTDDNGEMVPLDEILGISSPNLFNTIQSMTDPIFQVNNTFGDDNCDSDFGFSLGGSANESVAAPRASSWDGDAERVVVLQEAKVGPFGAQLIKATSSDALYTWLAENGYLEDPVAKPILDHYVASDYVFLGLKLITGKDTGDIQPISLHLEELAPCVPLKLTGIAATDDMPMLIWVLGEGRAIPKNFIHAVVNPGALIFPSGSNYLSVVNEAVDSVTGRAWVTEFAGPAEPFSGNFYNQNWSLAENFEDITTIDSAVSIILGKYPNTDSQLQSILKDTVDMPQGLMGYPFGNCYALQNSLGTPWDPDFECEDNTQHRTTPDEFYMFLNWWIGELDEQGFELTGDWETLKHRYEDEIITPLVKIEEMFENATTVTRFYTTQSAEEMTKDPIFAFNPDLEDVDRVMTVDTLITNPNCDGEVVIATYPTGQQYMFDCGGNCFGVPNFGPIEGASPLLYAQVLDEQGPPINFDPEYAAVVDGQLEFAQVGSPSLPSSFDLPEAPAPKFESNISKTSGGCTSSHPSSRAPLFAFMLLCLMGISRKTHPRNNS